MRISYAILVHRNPEQFGRLLQALSLNAGDAEFFVHIDAKTEARPFHQAVGKAESPRVHFVDRRTSVNWGGFSVVRATLTLMQAIVQGGRKFDYVILMSGQDYPIKCHGEIQKHLSDNAGDEFICYAPIPTPDWNVIDRLETYHFHEFVGLKFERYLKRAVGRILPEKRRIPCGFSPVGGSQWWGLTLECVEYILNFLAENPSFTRFFWFSLAPDELFFHTIIANSSFSERVSKERLTFVDWTSGGRSPKVLTMHDFDTLLQSNGLWARKFDVDVDAKILDSLDDHNRAILR